MSKPVPLVERIAPELRPAFLDIVALTDRFCALFLNVEYRDLCRLMAVAVCEMNLPIARGKRASWASGIVYTVGWVNDLMDPHRRPHVRSEQIADLFGISLATMHSKSKRIREALELVPMHPAFCLPSLLEENPLVWLLEVDGEVVDVRTAPRWIQVAAHQQGLIPYLPKTSGKRSAAPERKRKRERQPRPRSGLLLQFRISLLGTDPPIWRRIQVTDCTLDKLHEHIQTAMGWKNAHLYQFEIGGKTYGDPDLLETDFRGAKVQNPQKVLLSQLVPENGKRCRFHYEYDFGDHWQHEVLFEGYPPLDKRAKYPLCLEGQRACPPEDVGGVCGYEDFLAALADPQHEDHQDMLSWHGSYQADGFDPKAATRRMRRGLPNW